MKRLLSFILVISGLFVFCLQSGAAKPEITYPAQYAEFPSNKGFYFITWSCTDTNVDHYLVAVRKFTKTDREDGGEGTKIVNNVNVGTSRLFSISGFIGNNIEKDCLYKIKICVVRTNGTRTWSSDGFFYTSTHNGIEITPLSFKIWFGFTDLTKNQIYYAAQTWHNVIGGDELINTYPFTDAVLVNQYPVENGVNAITKVALDEDDDPYFMETTSYYYTPSLIEYEADINVNPSEKWANSAQPLHLDVQSVMTHEMGHALGLTDKFNDETWARYPYSLRWTMFHETPENDTHMRSPEQYDIDGVHNIYPD